MMDVSFPLINVLPARARLGEGTVWDATNQLLYWVDIYNHRVHQFEPATGTDVVFEVGHEVGCLGLEGRDRLILGLRDHLAWLDIQTGGVTPIRPVEADNPKTRLNDGKCDPGGRFWVGSMSEEEQPEANLYRYDPDGSLHVMETGLTISNGLGWSPDQTVFYLTDTPRQTIYAYDYDVTTGDIQNRRVCIDLSHESFFPDGLAIDAQGYIWSAMWNGWCVIRFDPEGQEVMRVAMPVPCPTCCTFGGSDLTDLYITTASVGLSQAEIQKGFYSGDLFCLKTDVVGLPANSLRVSS
ncbi:MAG: SMP-30/gluconolactonase/LRE family protein [Leptolyngbyaceae cyanobacterium bins.349]|nr:SMP-30/gluconolactonase/LRE family protein [Leptolyngbyaceae cyanobacterium bins.349]